ncbi:MAG: four helix bundle protein [Acidobacteria bacterium]|nr:four helix bundle protein [Acidobacteriota bacterium]
MAERTRQDLAGRAFNFSVGVSNLCRQMTARHGDDDLAHMARQSFRAAASIGANIEEGQVAFSRRDMATKYAIALRESRETLYWLRLIAATRPALTSDVEPLITEAREFVAMLTTSVRRLRER